MPVFGKNEKRGVLRLMRLKLTNHFLAGRLLPIAILTALFFQIAGGQVTTGLTGASLASPTIDSGYGVYIISGLFCQNADGTWLVNSSQAYKTCTNAWSECEEGYWYYDSYYGYYYVYPTCEPAQETCDVSVTLTPDFSKTNFAKYEGSCMIAAITQHSIDPESQANKNLLADTGYDSGQPGWTTSPITWVNSTGYLGKFEWDRNETACEALGGDWLEDTNSLGVTSSQFNNYRCCGDDWIWVNNKVINYKAYIPLTTFNTMSPSQLCLYPAGSSAPTAAHPFPYAADSSKYEEYRCYNTFTDGTHTSSNDLQLLDDDSQSEDGTERPANGMAKDTFYLLGTSPSETDVGKWSATAAGAGVANKLYCGHTFVNSNDKGDTFWWDTIGSAAEKNQIICELHLGYNWTGVKCCGDEPSETYNDNTTECDAVAEAKQLLSENSGNPGYYSSWEFEKDFPVRCKDHQTRNGACYNGKLLNTNAIASSYGAGSSVHDIISFNGTLYGCKPASGDGPIKKLNATGLSLAGSYDLPKCTFFANSVCAYQNDSWFMADATEGSLAKTLFGYDGTNTASESVLPTDPDSRSCCFSGSCWNGETCVKGAKAFYYNDAGVFKPLPGLPDNHEGWETFMDKEVYTCTNSTWKPSYPKFNWYHDTSTITFCSEPFACECGSTATEPYDYSCGTGTVNSIGCLNITPNFFKDDHYCEAVYTSDTSSNIVNSTWTSRTKLLALQMIKLAGSSDYVLFCDTYPWSVNYFTPLIENFDGSVNSVCTLEYGGNILLGFSFNKPAADPGDSMNFEIQNVLYNAGGFIDRALEEGDNIPNCDFGISNTENDKHGTYKKCCQGNNCYDGSIGSKAWYNNRTKSLIYAKEGISSSQADANGILTRPAWKTDEAALMANFNPILAYINSHIYEIEHDNAKFGMGVANFTSDFNRIYINKKGSKTIFGVFEKKYINDYGLRNIMAVSYNGFSPSSINCAGIKTAYPEAYCGTDAGNRVIVLERGELIDDYESFDYWNDLTAMVRLG
jgi:hypothetical protein